MDSRAINVKITLIWTVLMLLATETDSFSFSMPDCSNTSCGNLTIPFPFSTRANCIRDDSFLIICNESYNPPKPFLKLGSTEILDISVDGLMKVRSSIASDCYDRSGSRINRRVSEHTSYQFPISTTRNKFTAIGCDTYAFFEGSEDSKQTSAGCVSLCDSINSVVDGTCSGMGCCQTSILHGVKDFLVDVGSFRNHSKVGNFNPCGYAFVAEAEAFEFSSLDLKKMMNRTAVPVVLDWSIGNVTCQVAQKSLSSYACQALHSECIDARHGLGYRCHCVKGFQGNPYLPDGCQDIDECKTSKPCIGTCLNFVGNYSCSCPEGLEGDGETNGSGCHRKSHHPKNGIEGSTVFYIASGLMIPGVGIFWIFRRRKLNKLTKLRRNTFEGNGGLMLESTVRVFTAEQLKNATDNYDDSRILGRSVFGTVYRGKLDDTLDITITMYHVEEIKVFIRKLASFSQIQHRNVSRLIGCCLETTVPLLVHEFVSVNTLSDYIRNDDLASSLSWDIRLRIAAETAGALAYLHSKAGSPIIHGNLGSLTISLENGSTVKINDFAFTNCDSSAVLYWMGESADLDPEYLHSGQWTVKSDVYSFGVVLAELLTGEKSINLFRVNEHFVSSLEDALPTILDNRLAIDQDKFEQLTEVSKPAKKCLSDSSVERPTMKEVEVALSSIISGMNSNSTIVSQKSTQMAFARRLLRRAYIHFSRVKNFLYTQQLSAKNQLRWPLLVGF